MNKKYIVRLTEPERDELAAVSAAVRAALTDDGLPPLAASGLKLQDQLNQIAASLDHVAARALLGAGRLKPASTPATQPWHCAGAGWLGSSPKGDAPRRARFRRDSL